MASTSKASGRRRGGVRAKKDVQEAEFIDAEVVQPKKPVRIVVPNPPQGPSGLPELPDVFEFHAGPKAKQVMAGWAILKWLSS
jgi:hypothetical protein